MANWRIPPEVAAAVRLGQKIEAIRHWRLHTRCDLRTAKDFIAQNFVAIGRGDPISDDGISESALAAPAKDGSLPKEALLLKILNMTTSDNDGVTLVSIRKANKLLEDSGWTWEKLLSGKIKVVENPFKNIADPFGGFKQAPSAPPAPPAAPMPPQPRARPFPSPPPSAAAAQRQRPAKPSTYLPPGQMWVWDDPLWKWIADPSYTPPPIKPYAPGASAHSPASLGKKEISTKPNRYAKHCYCCGKEVEASFGWVFNPHDFNTNAKNSWEVVCGPCNTNVHTPISASRAKKRFASHQASSHVDLGDL